MVDRLTPEQRHKNMKNIRNKDSDIELMLRRELWARGMHYRKNVKGVVGHPDIAFKTLKIAVFCDSEFWHGYDWENHKDDIKSNQAFWKNKIERNIAHDRDVNSRLESEGWTVLRFWGNEIKKNVSGCADIIEKTVKEKKGCTTKPLICFRE